MQLPIRPGNTVRAHVTATDGADVTADICADAVDRLGCGCLRVRGLRPGPQVPGDRQLVELLTGVCGLHACDIATTTDTHARRLGAPMPRPFAVAFALIATSQFAVAVSLVFVAAAIR